MFSYEEGILLCEKTDVGYDIFEQKIENALQLLLQYVIIDKKNDIQG